MLFGKYASNKSDAAFPSLWTALDHAWSPCITSPSGNSLWDLVGRNNHGTNSGLVGTDWDRAFGFNSLNYDGTDNFTAMPRRVFAGRSVFSVMMWVKMAATSDKMEIGEADNANARFAVAFSDGNVSIVNSPTSPIQNFCFASWVPLGTSSLICAVYVYDSVKSTRAERAAIYLQGVPQTLSYSGVGSMTGAVPTFASQTQLGRRATGDNYSKGQLLSCAVWSRALKPAEASLAHKIGPAGLFKAKPRSYFGAASFQSYWARRQSLIIGGGLQ
jgi:hypothetical protein